MAEEDFEEEEEKADLETEEPWEQEESEEEQPTEESPKAFRNWCPNCKACNAVKVVEHRGEGKVRVKCVECGYEWECFI